MTSTHPSAPPTETSGHARAESRPGAHGHHGPPPVTLLHPDARRLARAATDLDTDLIVQIVQASVDAIGVVSTWEQFVQPVWQYLGSRTAGNGESAAAEHSYVQSAMRALSATRRPPRPSPPTVLLAGADEEVQVFALEALVAALEEAGVPCCALGACVPPGALMSAVARLRPTVVTVWSQTGHTADPAPIERLLAAYPHTTLIAAGPGWNSAVLPPQALRPTDLNTALILTLAVLEAHRAAGRPARAAPGDGAGARPA